MARVFVGREGELETLEGALGDRQGFLLLTGEPGIGKTRLAEELAARAEGAGFLVAWGRSWEGEGTPAYFPWLGVFRALATHAEARSAIAEATRTSRELAALLGVATNATPADPNEAQFRLYDAATRLLVAIAEQRPLLVVLDDLHAADTSSLYLLAFAARHVRIARDVLVVATMRDTAYRPTPEHEKLLARISREAREIPLARLGREHVATWVARAAPELAPSVDRVHSASEGNPLFVGELLAAAKRRAHDAWTSANALPLGIREAIRAHLGLLSDATLRVLEIASVLGREPSRARLATLAGADPASAIAEAVAGGVLVETGHDTLRFTHVLMRDELDARLTPERRAELHRAAAEHEDDPTLAAPHWLAGARAEHAPRAVAVVREAMRSATARLAFDDAALLGQRAAEALGSMLDARTRADLVAATAEGWRLGGHSQAARKAAEEAAAIARELDDAALLATAALLFPDDGALGNRDERAIALLREARTALERTHGASDTTLRAQVMARLSAALLPTVDEAEHVEAMQLGDEAIAMARRLNDATTLVNAIRVVATSFPRRLAPEARHARNAEAIALARRTGKLPLVVPLFAHQIATFIERGDPDSAARELTAMASALEALPQPHYRWRLPLVRAMLAANVGRFDEADAASREALRIARDNGLVSGMMLVAAQRQSYVCIRGVDDGWNEFSALTPQGSAIGPLFMSLTNAALGRVDEARAGLAVLDRLPLATIPGVSAIGWTCAEIGDAVHGAMLLPLLVAEEDEAPWIFGPASVVSAGPRALVIGRLQALLGRTDEALAAFGRALALAEKNRALPFVAQTEIAWAEVLRARDPATARAKAERAHAIAAELGMPRVLERADAILGSAPRSVRPSRPPAPEISMVREGEVWRIGAAVVKDSKGAAYLAVLLREPQRSFHALELVGGDDRGDAGPMLDAKAKQQYRERADSLREELDEATRHADTGRAERAREELEALGEELARAVGLGGRDRKAASQTERARVNVTRRIKDVIRRIAEQDEAVGEHLERSVKTGSFCVYAPRKSRV